MTAPYSKLQSEPLSGYERELLAFSVRWEPYGGGDEFILPHFGIGPALFYRRVLDALRPVRDHQLSPDEQKRLLDFCIRKLDAQYGIGGGADCLVQCEKQ
ncbi:MULTISPECIES: hypothetical protein [Rhodococcus]|uniref:DUF3263 domain-containing protein n=1 Tax=Rhodococcus wratislaviensis NBRC 100605 TaxID=1219028 RepID=X0PZR6_RHOWR|nr:MULTISPECIES: hypothetical protein [Rhodococcus]WAM19551.1 hypothetical protein OYT95_38410 [Rhodococcus sp. JS3073]GAF49088.1 hypothetical protein RW1_067_00220 [Rhodococcus wratislaviensis NBRC 100605]